MKIREINTNELEFTQSGVPSVIFGVVSILAGIGVATLPFMSGAEWWWSLVGAGITAIGAIISIMAKTRRVTLRREGYCEINDTKVITKKSDVQNFTASQVTSISLESSTHYERDTSGSDRGEMQRVRESILYALLNDGTQVVLATDKSRGGGVSLSGINLGTFGKPPLSKEAERIATFFNVPLNSKDLSSGGAVNFGNVTSTPATSATQTPVFGAAPETASPVVTSTAPLPVATPAPAQSTPASPEFTAPTARTPEAPSQTETVPQTPPPTSPVA